MANLDAEFELPQLLAMLGRGPGPGVKAATTLI